MSFERVQDQSVALKLLRQILTRRRVPAGLMFWGPDGVGKRMTAFAFAQALNCEHRMRDGSAEACGACLACRKTEHGNHPDVKLIVPSDRSREIKRADIDEVNELAALRPFESAQRLFVFEDADRMNVSAQNHFLKTLEEPPGPSVFVLVTAFPRRLLPTIRSRCQPIRFGALRPETVAAILMQERGLAESAALSIARIAEGQVSRAFDLVDSDKRAIVLDIARRLRGGESPLSVADEFKAHLDNQRKAIESQIDVEEAVPGTPDAEVGKEDKARIREEQAARIQAAYKRSLDDYLYLFETWYRDEMVLGAIGGSAPIWNQDCLDEMTAAAPAEAAARIRAIEQARYFLDRFVNEDRVFRHLFINLSGAVEPAQG